jgi:hypothetical protein
MGLRADGLKPDGTEIGMGWVLGVHGVSVSFLAAFQVGMFSRVIVAS